MKRVFSGIQPSGDIHIGNYIGAIKQWVAHQDESENIFCIVDLHAITVPQSPEQLKQKIRQIAAIYLAAGIDTKKSHIFVQSEISQHAELAWILNCFTPMGWMNRMTQFKEKSLDKKDSVSIGLFDYPVLMAADILLYNTDQVPVGEDQKQHVELTRDIAEKFNSNYGQIFHLPTPIIPKSGARIMSLVDPTKKMSKSDSNPNSRINLLDTDDDIRSKISKATTDSDSSILFDPDRPGIYNLLTIYQAVTDDTRESIEAKFAGQNYGQLKADLSEKVIEFLTPIRSQIINLTNHPHELDSILRSGANAIRPLAIETLTKVKSAVGLGLW